jgi:hypothetical protein
MSSKLSPIRLVSAVVLFGAGALAAAAQQNPPTEKPLAPQSATTGSSQTKPATHPFIGLAVVSIDGSNVGDVRAVNANPDGKVTALRIRSGGFLGFGARIVEIPEGSFMQTGDTIQLTLTAQEVSRLPEVKDVS